jgi:hypothetical protein
MEMQIHHRHPGTQLYADAVRRLLFYYNYLIPAATYSCFHWKYTSNK